MEHIIEMTGSGRAGKTFSKIGARSVDRNISQSSAGRSDKKIPKAAVARPITNNQRSWGEFYTRAEYFGLQEQDLSLLMQMGRVTHTRDGQELFSEGESNDVIYIILDGRVKLGKTTHKPLWLDMGPYGMVNMDDDDKEPVWDRYKVCTPSSCLGGAPLTREACHSLTAVSEGECDLLVLESANLESQLFQQGGGHQSARILTGLRQMLG
ncbi:MAG: cyclic nucleotide-binding domain-containing protein [Magnetococcales bacterium]|nr:cyclic nucleotide-binding domain-containing protein [Magnetococcales bacterium]